MLPVGVVELELDELDLRVGVQKLLQHLRVRVEGEAPVADQALFLLLLHKVPDTVIVILFIIVALQRVEQVVVEVSRARALQRGVELLLGAGLVVGLEPGVELGA